MKNGKQKMSVIGIAVGVSALFVLMLVLTSCASDPRTDDISTVGSQSVASSPSEETTSPDDISETGTVELPVNTAVDGTQADPDADSTQSVTTGKQPNEDVPPATSATEEEPIMDPEIDTSQYNLYTYTLRYWEGDTVYNESVYPMTTQNGENETVQLLYPATKILEVRSSDLKTVYKEGRDYQLVNGDLVIPQNSRIKINKYNEYYLNDAVPNHAMKRLGGGYIYFS